MFLDLLFNKGQKKKKLKTYVARSFTRILRTINVDIVSRKVWRTCISPYSCAFHLLNTWAATWQNQQNECAPIEDSDQPGHPPSLIRVFVVRTAKTEQTWRMPRLIWVFAGRTCHFVCFDMRRLIFLCMKSACLIWFHKYLIWLTTQ